MIVRHTSLWCKSLRTGVWHHPTSGAREVPPQGAPGRAYLARSRS